MQEHSSPAWKAPRCSAGAGRPAATRYLDEICFGFAGVSLSSQWGSRRQTRRTIAAWEVSGRTGGTGGSELCERGVSDHSAIQGGNVRGISASLDTLVDALSVPR